jgi:hypothetical protein
MSSSFYIWQGTLNEIDVKREKSNNKCLKDTLNDDIKDDSKEKFIVRERERKNHENVIKIPSKT